MTYQVAHLKYTIIYTRISQIHVSNGNAAAHKPPLHELLIINYGKIFLREVSFE